MNAVCLCMCVCLGQACVEAALVGSWVFAQQEHNAGIHPILVSSACAAAASAFIARI